MPVDINRLTEGWLELESDPGLFTLLLENFGVKGVQVEDIYDLQISLEGPVYGFIFLFRWIEERRSRRKIVLQTESFVKDEEVVNNIFFAQQMVPNSCATHALLSVLLNCPSLHLGSTLSRLKAHTSGMSPENKGWAIGNTPELAKAHNSHAMPQAKRRLDKSTGISTGRCVAEAFHFVSYVPIGGRLFELDGLKPFPIDHGPWGENEDWTAKFRRVITERLGIATEEIRKEIRFNLMAVVPDKRLALTHKLQMLKTNRQTVLEALQQLVKLSVPKIKKPKPPVEEKVESPLITTEDGSVKTSEIESTTEVLDEIKTEIKPTMLSSPLDPNSTNVPDPILEVHNYAKIPSIPKTNDTPKTNIVSENLEDLFPADYSTPLMIQTSPAPSSSSTDTSSEVGSAFNSPTQGWGWNSGQNSPTPTCTKDFKKFVVIRVFGPGEDKSETILGSGRPSKRLTEAGSASVKKMCLDGGRGRAWNGDAEKQAVVAREAVTAAGSVVVIEENTKLCSKYPELFEPHTFAPKDLLDLLKSLESEITACEVNLRDENEKLKRYKIDDSRRTHNYDEFICTFLSMLAQQGHLADLVEQHLLLHKKPGIPIARVKGLTAKKQESKANSSRRRGRTKNRKRK